MTKPRSKQIVLIAILIAIFAVASIIWDSLAIKKPLKENYVKSEDLTLVTDTNNGFEVNKYVDSNGNVTFADDKGYAILTRERDDQNRVLRELYFDADNNPAMRDNCYGYQYTYTENSRTSCRLTKDYTPINRNGITYTVREYLTAEHKDFIEHYYDENMNQVRNSSDTYGIRYYYDEGNHVIKNEWLDLEDNIIRNRDGYSVVTKDYNENNHLIREMYYDADGAPATALYGEYGKAYTYNDKNKRESVTTLDASGTPMASNAGYATVRYTYYDNGRMETERYYNVDGTPSRAGKNMYGKRFDGDRVYYLDADGKDVVTLDGILGNYPFWVSVMGIIVCFILVLTPRKVNLVIVALFFVFIMYETLLDRLKHQPTMSLDLFWTYKEFFTSEFVRIQILNNIWLFVPYSLGLMRVITKKRFVVPLLLLPIVIELTQYFMGIGLLDVDDLISNGLGEIIGIGIWYVASRLSTKKA